MLRVLAFLALAGTVGVAPAHAQSEPSHKSKHPPAAAVAAPADKAPDLPNGPLDVPRWMGNAVDNILSGETGKPGTPTNQ